MYVCAYVWLGFLSTAPHALSSSLFLSSFCVPALKYSRGLRFAKLIA